MDSAESCGASGGSGAAGEAVETREVLRECSAYIIKESTANPDSTAKTKNPPVMRANVDLEDLMGPPCPSPAGGGVLPAIGGRVAPPPGGGVPPAFGTTIVPAGPYAAGAAGIGWLAMEFAGVQVPKTSS